MVTSKICKPCTSNPPFTALVAYSWTYFTAFGMLALTVPNLFNAIVNNDPNKVSSDSEFWLGVFGVVNMVSLTLHNGLAQ